MNVFNSWVTEVRYMPLTTNSYATNQPKPETARLARVWLREFVSDQQQRAAMCRQYRHLVRRRARIGERDLRNECLPVCRVNTRKIHDDLPPVMENARDGLFCRRGSTDEVNDVRRLSCRQCETLGLIMCRHGMSLVRKH